MELDERSINWTLAVSVDRSVEPMAVIELLAKLTLANCLKRSNRAGTDVSLLLLRRKVSSGVVGSILSITAAIAESLRFLAAHDTVSVVLLGPRVAPQTHGAMSTAYVGHLQINGVRVDVDTTVPSVHLAAVAPDPN